MKKQILIETGVLMTRIAVLFEGEWVNFYVDSHLEEDPQNKVVIGQISQVVKNLKAVFVDYGEDKKGLLHIKQIPECYQTRLHQGTRLPVQVVKQNAGEKGHKLTGKISIKGRHLVCLPFETGVNISKKIQNQDKRRELKEALEGVTEGKYGFIVRTHALNLPVQHLVKDAKELMAKADEFMATKDYLTKGTVLYKELPLAMQVVADALGRGDQLEIVCDDEALLEKMKGLVSEYDEGDLVSYTCINKNEDLFAVYGLTKQLEALMQRKIWLKNGGNLVIDYTEAMTVIDINSAKAVLTKNPRKSVLNLNLLAIKESIMQILRRNLSGMILLDLVEMREAEDKLEAYEYAKKCFANYQDIRSKVYPLTELGLLQISRASEHTPLHHKLFKECTSCYKPYSAHHPVYELFNLEKAIRHIKNHTVQQCVYVDMTPEFAKEFEDYKVKELLERTYELRIYTGKLEKTSKKMFLCKFHDEKC